MSVCIYYHFNQHNWEREHNIHLFISYSIALEIPILNQHNVVVFGKTAEVLKDKMRLVY